MFLSWYHKDSRLWITYRSPDTRAPRLRLPGTVRARLQAGRAVSWQEIEVVPHTPAEPYGASPFPVDVVIPSPPQVALSAQRAPCCKPSLVSRFGLGLVGAFTGIRMLVWWEERSRIERLERITGIVEGS